MEIDQRYKMSKRFLSRVGTSGFEGARDLDVRARYVIGKD